MRGHPGGVEHTLELLRRAGLEPPARILDMGAGGGETLRLLDSMGFEAIGVDMEPGVGVCYGDYLHFGLPDESFDAVISQCSFFLSGDPGRAFCEAYRVLRAGGVLLWSDVTFEDAANQARSAGFTVCWDCDMTALWREYYIECIWRGTADCVPCRPEGRCKYTALICRKE